ncbi:cytochrome P450 10-like [Anopheles stephensi]|uniref:cytochrome P450 10-like n=1 Tax=Anopheles stephensi TaxID=30069 RepID=UPI001658C3DB|nr:cytochrome P450 10-like [Anopheles stephensi]
MLAIVTSGVALLLSIVIWWTVANYGSALRYAGKLGGPVAYPLVGNGLLFINKTPAEFLQLLGRLIAQYGKCLRVWLGTQLIVLVTDPKDIEVLLSSPKYIDKSGEYDFIRPWLGEGLLISRGRKWQARRKIITPTFHFKILEQFIEIFDQQGNTFVDILRLFAKSGETFDVFPLVTLCALDVICESAMGTKVNAQINSESQYVKAVKEITNLIQLRIYDFVIRYEFFFRLSANRRRQRKALAILHGYTDSVIRARRQELNTSKSDDQANAHHEDPVGLKKRMAFLDMLLQATIDGRPLTDLEIREEVDTFMFEGHDTTTSAISFLLLSLAKNPDVQERVFNEVRNVVGDDRKQPVTMAMLNDMHYLELVIKETLRLYPSVPMFGRKMLQNTEINGKIFPAGSNVIMFPFFLGRDADFFPNPEKFDPERFNVETSAEKTNPYQYVPFSAGPRNCIGQKFAVAELKSLVSKVLRNFEILPSEEPFEETFIAELILRPERGVPIRVKPRVYALAMVLSTVVALLALAALGAIYIYQRFGEMLKHTGKLGGPPAYPLIGNGLLFLNKSPAEFLRIIGALLKQYGDCFRVWLGTQLAIVVIDPKDIEVLLSSPKYIDKSTEYDFIRPWLGEGLLTSRGRKWHTHRKVITPTFHFKILEQFVEIFDRQSTTFIKVLQPFAESGKSFDIFPQVTLCALDVICESAMGTKVNAQLNSTSDYVLAVKEITNLIQLRFYDFLIRYEFFFRLSANSRKQKKVLKVLHNYTDSVIKGRRQQLEANASGGSTEETSDQDLGIKKRMAFLDMLLQSTVDGRPLTDLEIREEVDTFMFEGHDTTTSAISFLLLSLAKNPDIQQKVFEEVRDIVGDDRTRPVTMAMLNDMSYLDLVIKETLRLYPSVPMIGRKMLQTTEINGKILPAGANLIIMPFFLGRDARYFPDPERFDPERFNVERSAEKANPYQYIPFSAGPRNCIGQKFAVAELKSLVSKVLRHYEILPSADKRDESFIAELILRPEHGVFVHLKPRVY